MVTSHDRFDFPNRVVQPLPEPCEGDLGATQRDQNQPPQNRYKFVMTPALRRRIDKFVDYSKDESIISSDVDSNAHNATIGIQRNVDGKY